MFSNITNEINKITNKLAGSSVATAKSVAKAIRQLGEYVGTGGEDNSKTMVVHIERDETDATQLATTQLRINDARAGEIYEAMQNGYIVFAVEEEFISEGFGCSVASYVILNAIYQEDQDVEYFFDVYAGTGVADGPITMYEFQAASENDYPATEGGK